MQDDGKASAADEVDMMCVTTLYIALIENNVGKIDGLIPTIIERCYDRM